MAQVRRLYTYVPDDQSGSVEDRAMAIAGILEHELTSRGVVDLRALEPLRHHDGQVFVGPIRVIRYFDMWPSDGSAPHLVIRADVEGLEDKR